MRRATVVRAGFAASLLVAIVTEPLIASAIVSSGPTSAFAAVTPARLLDTRTGHTTVDGLFAGGGALGAGATLDLTVGGRGGVPADATAVVMNVTATGATAASYLTVFPTGATRPNSSSINFTAGTTVANLVTVGTGAGKVSIYNAVGAAQVLVDVTGYYTASGLNAVVESLAPITTTATLFTGAASIPAAGTVKTIGSVTTTLPVAGTLDVQFQSQGFTQFPANSGASALFGTLFYATCTVPDTLSTGCDAEQQMFTQKAPANNSGLNATFPLNLRTSVHLAAGQQTLYLNAQPGTYLGGLYGTLQVVVVFTPSAPVAVGTTLTLTLGP